MQRYSIFAQDQYLINASHIERNEIFFFLVSHLIRSSAKAFTLKSLIALIF